uniref:Aldo keto reductase n=1 Tax=Tetraselmis sp. GSL018 TaxID=582737 RepID=A0A061R728_9CHLO
MTTDEPEKQQAEEQEVSEQEQEETQSLRTESEPPPDPVLKELYGSTRPSVQLIQGIPLAPIICSVWPAAEAETLLQESWIPTEQEPAEDTEPPRSFDPAAPEYNVIPRRIAKSAAMVEWNQLKKDLAVAEKKFEKTPDKEAEQKEELGNLVAELQERLAEAEAQLTDVKGSYGADPLSLVPWMNTLFALADAGLTTFDVSGPSFPHCPLHLLFGEANSLDMYAGVERMLATFKRRYEMERGPNRVQIFTKLVPNIFSGLFSPQLVTAAVDRSLARMELQQIDMVQVRWWDLRERDVVPTLKAVKALTIDEGDVDPETGAVSVTAPAKVRAVGLLDFPFRGVLDAIQMGIPVTMVQVNYHICDTSAEPILGLCAKYGIKVAANNGTLGGLINEKYLGVESPDSLVDDPDLDSVAECLDLVQKFGGWERLQSLLEALKSIADKHRVSMQSVAVRFQMDRGTFPVLPVNWEPFVWMPFGNPVWLDHNKPGVDEKLFHKASFLDEDDLALIASRTR